MKQSNDVGGLTRMQLLATAKADKLVGCCFRMRELDYRTGCRGRRKPRIFNAGMNAPHTFLQKPLSSCKTKIT